MVFVKVGKVKISRWKLLSCKDNTLFSITFELVVRFWCFNFCLKALDVFFTRSPCFYFWVGSFLLESAEKRTKESKKCGLISSYHVDAMFKWLPFRKTWRIRSWNWFWKYWWVLHTDRLIECLTSLKNPQLDDKIPKTILHLEQDIRL